MANGWKEMGLWDELGADYPGTGSCARVIFDVLAPVIPRIQQRSPVYELGHEETPSPMDVWSLAQAIANALSKEGLTHD